MGFITRSFHCEVPHNHKRSGSHIVWGTDRQHLLIYTTRKPIIADITPHIISFQEIIDGKMNIAVTCGVLGCGIELIDPSDSSKGINFLDVRTYEIPEKEWVALLDFKNTGYELIKSYKR